jgi:hypothetical protein
MISGFKSPGFFFYNQAPLDTVGEVRNRIFAAAEIIQMSIVVVTVPAMK